LVAVTFENGHRRGATRSLLAFLPFGRWALTAAVLILALLLGGSTRQGLWSDAAIQIVSLVLLALSLATVSLRDAPRLVIPCIIIVAAVALPVLYLVPLPFEWWSVLPGRSMVVDEYRQIGIAAPWLPISLDAPATGRAALSLVPPIAVFLATVQFGHRARRSLSLLFVAAGIVSVMVGLAQLMQGPDSGLRFYPITNPSQSVGFFANRNHYAALLYCLIPITAAWLTGLLSDRRPERWFGLVAAALISVALILGLGMAQSRAGVILAVLVAIGSLLLAGVAGNGSTPRNLAVLAATMVVGVGLAVQFAFFGVFARFNDGVIDQFRLTIASITANAARAFQPLGSGFGTFVPVYQMFEPPDALITSYVNHAHNDWLELWLEGGWPALAIVAVFLVWFALATIKTWRSPPHPGTSIDRTLARASSISIFALLLHSAVDYPLRTTALMTLFAFCCALLVEPIPAPSAIFMLNTDLADWRRWFERRLHARRTKGWQRRS
jgi:O-antigen ligase